uniref:Uncharacterized protein n=1 Tax=Macaca fascicularis TaxID=9541 RepID=A0A7N9CPE7_MACFA
MTTIHELSLFMKLNTVMCCLTAGIHSEKCIAREFEIYNIIIYLWHKPRWHSIQNSEALW